MLKEEHDHSYTIVYDLQHVQVLPKVTVQEAYDSRQLSLYNFALPIGPIAETNLVEDQMKLAVPFIIFSHLYCLMNVSI